MSRSMWIAATGMMAQQLNIDVISNNLANVNTVGFKKSRADFEDLMYQKITVSQASYDGQFNEPMSLQVGLGVRNIGTPKMFTQGNVQQTQEQLDFSIEGEGFFMVEMPSGDTAYTRAGNLKKNSEGYLTTADGYLISPTVQVPLDTEQVFVDANGLVSVKRIGEVDNEQIGQFQMALFPNPAGLESLGRNLYRNSGASGDFLVDNPGSNGMGTITQGYLEASNVDIAEEMIKLIIAQRSYEVNSKAIQSADELLKMTNNLKR
jgi:flagellar basal-body rod protein FlgG